MLVFGFTVFKWFFPLVFYSGLLYASFFFVSLLYASLFCGSSFIWNITWAHFGCCFQVGRDTLANPIQSNKRQNEIVWSHQYHFSVFLLIHSRKMLETKKKYPKVIRNILVDLFIRCPGYFRVFLWDG